MVTWAEFSHAAPRLATLGERRLAEPGVVLVGTIRRDGTPRISPVEPLLWEGDLWLSMLFGSLKAGDLRRDSRVLVHSVITGRDGADGEFKLRGQVIEVPPGPRHDGYARQVRDRLGWEPTPERVHLFRVDIGDVTFIRYEEATGDQFVARWPANAEFVRRGDGGTALGPPAAHSDLLLHGD